MWKQSLCLLILPMLMRPPSKAFIAILNPFPSSQIKFSAGTLHSLKITARVGWEFQPNYRMNEWMKNKDQWIKPIGTKFVINWFIFFWTHFFLFFSKTKPWSIFFHNKGWNPIAIISCCLKKNIMRGEKVISEYIISVSKVKVFCFVGMN